MVAVGRGGVTFDALGGDAPAKLFDPVENARVALRIAQEERERRPAWPRCRCRKLAEPGTECAERTCPFVREEGRIKGPTRRD